jgi:hypothetical protein
MGESYALFGLPIRRHCLELDLYLTGQALGRFVAGFGNT